MYVSSRHPDRERLTSRESALPPTPTGETLFDFEREQGNARVRGSLETFNGHSFVRCQTWERGTAGRWWPRRSAAVTFRLRELDEVVRALSAIGPDARPSRESSPWADEQPQPARQGGRGAARVGSSDVRPVQPARRAVEAPRHPDEDDRPRFVDRRRTQQRFDPSALPGPTGAVISPDFNELGESEEAF